jgi:hypothetical protein
VGATMQQLPKPIRKNINNEENATLKCNCTARAEDGFSEGSVRGFWCCVNSLRERFDLKLRKIHADVVADD